MKLQKSHIRNVERALELVLHLGSFVCAFAWSQMSSLQQDLVQLTRQLNRKNPNGRSFSVIQRRDGMIAAIENHLKNHPGSEERKIELKRLVWLDKFARGRFSGLMPLLKRVSVMEGMTNQNLITDSFSSPKRENKLENPEIHVDRQTESSYVKDRRSPSHPFFLSSDLIATTKRRNGILWSYGKDGSFPSKSRGNKLRLFLQNLQLRTPYISHSYGSYELRSHSREERFKISPLDFEENRCKESSVKVMEFLKGACQFEGSQELVEAGKVRFKHPLIASCLHKRRGHVLVVPCLSSEEYNAYVESRQTRTLFCTATGRTVLFVCRKDRSKKDSVAGSSFVIKGHRRTLREMKAQVAFSALEETEAYPMLNYGSRSEVLMNRSALSQVQGDDGQVWVGYRSLPTPPYRDRSVSNPSLREDERVMMTDARGLDSDSIQSLRDKASHQGKHVSLLWWISPESNPDEGRVLISFNARINLYQALKFLPGLSRIEIIELLKCFDRKFFLEQVYDLCLGDLTEDGLKLLCERIEKHREIRGVFGRLSTLAYPKELETPKRGSLTTSMSKFELRLVNPKANSSSVARQGAVFVYPWYSDRIKINYGQVLSMYKSKPLIDVKAFKPKKP